MRKLIKNLFTSSLIVALGFTMAADPAAAAAPKPVKPLVPQATAQRQALMKKFTPAKRSSALSLGAAQKPLGLPPRPTPPVSNGSTAGKTPTASPHPIVVPSIDPAISAKRPTSTNGNAKFQAKSADVLSATPKKTVLSQQRYASAQESGLTGNALTQSLRNAPVSRQLSASLGTETGNGRQFPSGLNPKDLTRLDRLQGIKDPSAALKAAMNVPEAAGAASKNGDYDPSQGTNYAELIAESQGRTTTGNSDPEAGKNTAPWSQARELANREAKALREGVAQGLAEFGVHDTRSASGIGEAPHTGGGSGLGSSVLDTAAGSGSVAARFDNPRDANIDETSRLAEASLWFPGMTTGPSLDEFANGGDPRTERKPVPGWTTDIVNFSTSEGTKITIWNGLGIGIAQTGEGGPREVLGHKDKKNKEVLGKDSQGNTHVVVKDKHGGTWRVILPKDKTVQPDVSPEENKKDGRKKNPNPYDDDVRGAEISEQVLRGFNAKFNGMKDPANEDGPAPHDVDKLIGVTIAHIMSKVNPLQDGPLGGGGGNAPTPSNPLIGPRDPSTAPGRGGTKGPKPGITAPLGPPRRAAELLSGQGDVAASSTTGNQNGGALADDGEDADGFDPTNPQQGNSSR
jgi:hypothetical protein